jgi:hypothetical protein
MEGEPHFLALCYPASVEKSLHFPSLQVIIQAEQAIGRFMQPLLQLLYFPLVGINEPLLCFQPIFYFS